MLSAAIDNLRHSVRDLRALLVDLHPPHLAAAGLEAAIRDLVSPLEARGIEVGVVGRRDGAPRPGAGGARLPGGAGGAAQRRRPRAGDPGERRRDGRAGRRRGSSSPTTAAASRRSSEQRAPSEGHLGLSLLEEVARQSGAELDVRSSPGDGHDRRARGAAPMTQGADRRRPRRAPRRARPCDRSPAGPGARRDGRERRRGGRALSASTPRTSCSWISRCRSWTASRRPGRSHAHEPGDRGPRPDVVRRSAAGSRGALDAGAVGYLLKDASADEVVQGVRAAALGRLAARPAGGAAAARGARGAGPARRALSPREREVLRAPARGDAEQADRAPARDQREDREVAPDERLPGDRRHRPRAGGPLGRAAGGPRRSRPVATGRRLGPKSRCGGARSPRTLTCMTDASGRPGTVRLAAHRACAALVLCAALVAAGAAARDGKDGRGEVRVAGSCGARATSKLKLKSRDGGIELEFEVDHNRAGSLVARRDRARASRGLERRGANVGTERVVRRRATAAGSRGPDTVTARAWGPAGVTCRATATLPGLRRRRPAPPTIA